MNHVDSIWSDVVPGQLAGSNFCLPIDMDSIWPAERNIAQGPPFLLIIEHKKNTETNTNTKTHTTKKTFPIDMDSIWPAERNTVQGPPCLL